MVAPSCYEEPRRGKLPRWASIDVYEARFYAAERVEPGMELEDLPTVGDPAFLAPSAPFRARAGDSRWLLYEPFPVSIDGMLAWMEHIPRCGLVRAVLLEQAGPTIFAEVAESLPVEVLRDHFPARAGEPCDWLLEAGGRHTARSGRWGVVDWSAEGDIGAWALLDGDDLVLQGEWAWGHQNDLHAGRLPLGPGQRRALGL